MLISLRQKAGVRNSDLDWIEANFENAQQVLKDCVRGSIVSGVRKVEHSVMNSLMTPVLDLMNYSIAYIMTQFLDTDSVV